MSAKSDKSSKKMKQVCLPFKLVNSPGEDANSKCRKRKLSGTENDETGVENPNVELLNGGTKCFIKSDDENKTLSSEEISKDVNNKMDTTEFVPEISMEKTEKDIISDDASEPYQNIKDVEDVKSISSNSNVSQDIIVKSTSNDVKLENNSSTLNTPTPKRKLKKQESAKKQEERLRLKQEKEKEKERIREEKLKEQAEKQRIIEQKRIAEIEAKRLRELEKEREKKQKEEEKKAKELEKEQERKLKEEEKKAKDLEKEQERKLKEEEKKAKELEKERERKQKEQEKKAKELEKEKQKEEKLLKEEMEKKKKEKTKAAFIGFFKQKSFDLDTSKKENEIINKEQETYFMPFQTKQDMKMAPFCRAYLNNDKKKSLDNSISHCENDEDVLYLSLLKNGKYKPSKSEKTWPVHVEDDDDIIVIESGTKNDEEDLNDVDIYQKHTSSKIHWKLLQFEENRRPPYWGTWRKKSLYVKPRRPFACDKIMFDYEVYSDDEWEEEDPGESIHGTDNEEEPEDDYEVDNDVFVPHGYLSDEEGDQDNDNASKESQKEKLKLLGEEFEAEIKKKTERIKPRIVGCLWIPNNVTNPENVSKPVADTLLKYRSIWDNEEPILTEEIIINSPSDLSVSENKKILLLPDSIMPDLIKFIHANTSGIKIIAKDFINELEKNGRNVNDNTISLSSVRKTIKHIATKSSKVAPWYVSKENFEKYNIEYLKDMVLESPKPIKATITKITSFMTPQSEKTKVTLLDKSRIEMEKKIPEQEKTDFVPKDIFNVKKISSQMKEEQQINIVGGKKRITPIFLSPKKKFKSLMNRMPRDKSLSPEIKIVNASIINPNLTNETI